MAEYYVYENWRAEGHKARLHLSICSFCNNGRGLHRKASGRNGRWLGPFDTLESALTAANRTGGRVSKCKFCM